MSDQLTGVSTDTDQLAGLSSETDQLPGMSNDLEALQFGKKYTEGSTVSDEENHSDVEITGETEGSSVVVKQERDDSLMSETLPFDDLDDSDDDVICLDRQTTIKYMTGEMSFDEYSALLEEQVKQEPVDTEGFMGIAQLESTTSGSHPAATEMVQPSTSTRKQVGQRKKRSKLPRSLQGLMGEANMKFARGETDEAIKMCMEIIRLAPTAPEPFHTLGMLYEEAEQTTKALQYLLIAAHLNPNDAEEWARLADMCLDQNNVQQALTCYEKAVKVDPGNIPLWWARCDLLEKTGDKKRAMEGYQQILNLLPKDNGEKYFQLARDMTTNFHTSGDFEKAMVTMATAFEIHPTFVSVEDVNLLLELYLALHEYKKAVGTLVRHCGVCLHCSDGTIVSAHTADDATQDEYSVPIRCTVPDELPVDLRSKFIVCAIYLRYGDCIQELVEPLLSEQPNDVGDLYLDVAEAFMEVGDYKQAKPILASLVHSENYNLAAVWLRHGECLNSLGELTAAVEAYATVVNLAPSHSGARVTLSTLQQQLGRHEEALETLEHEALSEEEEDDYPRHDLRLLVPKCLLLHTQQRTDEFIDCCRLLLFGHLESILGKTHVDVIVTNRSYKHRIAALRETLGTTVEKRLKAASAAITESNITVDDLWQLYLKLCDALVDTKQCSLLEHVTSLALILPEFVNDPEKSLEVDFICLMACLLNNNAQCAYSFIKELCIKELECNRAWNLFCQIITISQDIRHNRFCLRLMMKQQDHLALGILNGHNAMVAGTYKHALGEYVAAFRQLPDDPLLSLCIGITYIHMACQKFASSKHELTTQVISSLTFSN
ncbi:General transcription factor 3C polypeptide 3 [Lamellibrachia satsuma]|nr:General transcription factor 3C polypeptide 3 [Lamellibrachia satsuma]